MSASFHNHFRPGLFAGLCAACGGSWARRRVVPEAEGIVVEAGIGGGVNLPLYDKSRVKLVIGVDPDHAGSATFQVMFSVGVHLTGRFLSLLRPFADGPRHCGQFSARGTDTIAMNSPKVINVRLSIVHPYCSVSLFSSERREQTRSKRGACRQPRR